MTTNRALLLAHKATVDDPSYPVDYTALVVDTLLKSSYVDCRLEWQGRFCPEDYIDSIQPSDLKSPIMWGLDRDNRLFVAIRTSLNGKLGVETFFQRYTCGRMWVSGCHHNHYVQNFGAVNVVQCSLADTATQAYQHFVDLLLTGKTTLERQHYLRDGIHRFELIVE